MKINYKYILFVIVQAYFLSSCSDMNDLHDDYLKQGEIIYAAKVDSATIYPGREREQLNLYVGAQRIEKIRVYWDDYTDSVDVQIDNEMGLFECIIDSLEEKGYIFQVMSIDIYGNNSLPYEADGTVYGDNYQSGLLNRTITDATFYNGELTINWSGEVDDALFCNLIYTNATGDTVIKDIPMSDATTVITDYNADFVYNTVFLPEEAAIDTFYTDYTTPGPGIYVKHNKTGWEATADSYEATGQLPDGWPERTIDDDESTYWHTQHTGGMPGYPHWLAYDMKEELEISAVELVSRSDYLNADFTDFTVQKSSNGTDWEDCDSFELENEAGAQIFKLSQSISTRYIRIYMTAGPNSYTHLAEFSVGYYIE